MTEEISDETPFATRRFGDYEIVELIARGGMGIVYRARQTSLKRTVALKLIAMSSEAAPDFLERFRTEAEAASLDHPNIVSVYDFGEHEDQYFLAMQFVAGGTLRRDDAGEKRAAFSPDEAARIVGTTGRAVHHAHQRRILHRDIKPGNLLLDEAGEPHLTDFGLAKLIARDSAITRTSAVLGTGSRRRAIPSRPWNPLPKRPGWMRRIPGGSSCTATASRSRGRTRRSSNKFLSTRTR